MIILLLLLAALVVLGVVLAVAVVKWLFRSWRRSAGSFCSSHGAWPDVKVGKP
jgi:hypothetical protein